MGIVHGGMLATLMDESMGRCGLAALPGKIGYTANLKVDYRKPVKAGSYVVVRAEVVRLEGRKVWVRGRIEGLRVGVGGVGGVGGGEVGGKGEEGGEGQGDLLVEAEALFVEPKNAKVPFFFFFLFSNFLASSVQVPQIQFLPHEERFKTTKLT